MKQVAAAAGVSVNTVSLALRGHRRIAAAPREHVRAVADRLGYRPDPVVAAGMARLRRSELPDVGGLLMVLHATPAAELQRWEGIRSVLTGIQRRAQALGYRIEQRQLHYGADVLRHLVKEIRERGVPGLLIVGPWGRELMPALRRLLEQCSMLRCGNPLSDLPIHFCKSDHYQGTRLAMYRVLERGSSRPGLVLNTGFDHQQDGQISGAYLSAIQMLPAADRIPPLLVASHLSSQQRRAQIRSWWQEWRPDAILTVLKNESRERWLSWNPHRDPVLLVQVNRTGETPDWPGVTFPGRDLGHAAVDSLVSMIHSGESGPPRFQKGITVSGTWVDV